MQDDPQLQPRDSLAHYSQEAKDIETELAKLAIDFESNVSLVELHQYPAWKVIQAKIEEVTEKETQRLRRSRLDGYQLGKCQGMLDALEILGRDKPLTQAEVDARREYATVLSNRLTDLRKLLA